MIYSIEIELFAKMLPHHLSIEKICIHPLCTVYVMQIYYIS